MARTTCHGCGAELRIDGPVAIRYPRGAGVGAALPDPPFELMGTDGPAGFDIELMRHIAEKLGREWQLVPYKGADFNGIFAGLDDGSYDCVASGTTITPGRQAIADFCSPYCVSGQSLVVDAGRHPNVHSIDALKGLVIGVQQGNTSQPVAEKLVADGCAARVCVSKLRSLHRMLSVRRVTSLVLVRCASLTALAQGPTASYRHGRPPRVMTWPVGLKT